MKGVVVVHLEQGVEKFVEKIESAGGPPIYKLTPEKAREVLENLQSHPDDMPKIMIEQKKIPGPKGQLSLQIVRPAKSGKSVLPAALYMHGGGWILGSFRTHLRLVADIAVGADMALVFVEYTPSPEAHFPVALEEGYMAAQYIVEHARDLHLDAGHLAIIGDSVGGNLATGIALMAKQRKGPRIASQVLLYPVTNAEFTTPSYHQFAEGPWLTKKAMEWFWDAYLPDAEKRHTLLASPLKASLEQLQGLPRALVITDEHDVLRDEGEAYAHKLMQAGVEVTAVRMLGTIHDFAMLNDLAHTQATKAAIALVNQFLNR